MFVILGSHILLHKNIKLYFISYTILFLPSYIKKNEIKPSTHETNTNTSQYTLILSIRDQSII